MASEEGPGVRNGLHFDLFERPQKQLMNHHFTNTRITEKTNKKNGGNLTSMCQEGSTSCSALGNPLGVPNLLTLHSMRSLCIKSKYSCSAPIPHYDFAAGWGNRTIPVVPPFMNF